MSKWQTTLRINDLVIAYEDNKMTVQQVATNIVKRLRENKFASDKEMVEIVSNLDLLSRDVDANEEDFDYYMDNLYDFADRGMRIWVDAFSDEEE